MPRKKKEPTMTEDYETPDPEPFLADSDVPPSSPEPGDGECLLIDKAGVATVAPVDAQAPRCVGGYERTGTTDSGRPVYTEPQT
jgi:hypothetical protein